MSTETDPGSHAHHDQHPSDAVDTDASRSRPPEPVSLAGGPSLPRDHRLLRRELARVFAATGLCDDDADLAADALVDADLRGVSSHGVAGLAPRYVAWLRSGFVDPHARLTELRGATALRVLDAGRGLGTVMATRAMDETIERARETGIAMSVVANARHLGMAAFHAMRALDAGMIGICTTAVRPHLVPPGGRVARLGTNPIAVAVPAGRSTPFVFDAATTTISSNKLRAVLRAGGSAAAGWLVDEHGRPNEAGARPEPPFLLTPLGGTPDGSSHKGYGLAMTVDVLGPVLAQATFGAELAVGEAGHTLIAIDIAAISDPTTFRATMDRYLEHLRTTPTAVGHDEVLVPGDLEERAAARHRRDGLPVPRRALEWLDDTARDLGLSLDPALVATTGSGS